jgi:ATP-binding cassette, subfamily B, multidrug efflux pump
MSTLSERDATPHPISKPPLAWLRGIAWRYRRAAFAALAFGTVGGITSSLQPYLVGMAIDAIGHQATQEALGNILLVFTAITMITVAVFYGQRYFSGVIANSVRYEVRRQIFDNLLTLEQRFYQQHATGDLISRMHSDTDAIWRFFAMTFTRFGSAIFTLLTTFILLGSVSLPLTLMVFSILTVSTAFQMRAGRRLTGLFEDVQAQTGALSAWVQDSVSGIQTIKTFGAEQAAIDRYTEENREFRRRWLFYKRRYEPVGMLPNMIAESTVGLVVLIGGVMVVNRTITLGNFTQFMLYLAAISNVLLQLGTIYQRYQQMKGATNRLVPLLRQSVITDTADAQALPEPHGHVAYHNVSVDLDGVRVLHSINFTIKAGQTVAFVGPTGCGKSLLVSLLARVLDPTTGQIALDGHDLRTLKLDDLRRAVAYVPQSTFLFSQPLAHNVRMNQEQAEPSIIMDAVHMAGMAKDLSQLPEGLDTLVGERGVLLSGGQKQRVAIARAILHNAAVLVLDDALSSVDTHTAAEILGGLRNVMRQRTSIIIAHRIATVKDADVIYVMDEGHIVESGQHDQLLAQNGRYAAMAKREGQEAAQALEEVEKAKALEDALDEAEARHTIDIDQSPRKDGGLHA